MRTQILDATQNIIDAIAEQAPNLPREELLAATRIELIEIFRLNIPAPLAIEAIDNRASEILLEGLSPIDHCFVSGTLIRMWPEGKSIGADERCPWTSDHSIIDGEEKSIDEVRPGDLVITYNSHGELRPGRVAKVFENTSTHILDFWGIGITPGHATLCGEGEFVSEHVAILDILRTDGAVVLGGGELIRAATGCPVGSKADQFVHAITGEPQAVGNYRVKDHKLLRLGTRILLEDGGDVAILDLIQSSGGAVTSDGLILSPCGSKKPFYWRFSESLPKPEDYILKRSAVTLEEIYRAGEWEQVGTRLAPPSDFSLGVGDKPKPNIPPAFRDHPDAPFIAASFKSH